ncbi:MAG TPA: DUF1003 domain-containing protein [Actinomycetota bacterium]|nr:DUF1003 domain-containing protein [Actinomycetota bacterium]
MRLRFPKDAGPNRSPVNVRHHDRRTVGERVADTVTSGIGSWPFIVTQSILLALWIVMNALILGDWISGKPFDPYPFILLNLVLSFQAAYTGPVVMMSQNRQAAKDRDAAEHDYQVNEDALARLERLEETQTAILEQLRGSGAAGSATPTPGPG